MEGSFIQDFTLTRADTLAWRLTFSESIRGVNIALIHRLAVVYKQALKIFLRFWGSETAALENICKIRGCLLYF